MSGRLLKNPFDHPLTSFLAKEGAFCGGGRNCIWETPPDLCQKGAPIRMGGVPPDFPFSAAC